MASDTASRTRRTSDRQVPRDDSRSKPEAQRVKKTERSIGIRSYYVRIALLFGLVSIMTALFTALILAAVWNSSFHEYAINNVQSRSDSVARQLANDYRKNMDWPEDYEDIQSTFLEGNMELRIFDSENRLIYASSGSDEAVPAEIAVENSVSSRIVVDGEEIGTVYIHVSDSSLMMTQRDLDFRTNSYGALTFAALAAIIAAVGIGVVFSRYLFDSIRKITRTANAIKGGNLAARTNLTGSDEISQLGETFDAMAESIQNDRELERRLTSDVAHELRTPLMAMQATVEAMIDGVLPADDQHLNMIASEVNRLSKLVDALLRLSRLENRSTPINLEPINLGELLEELAYTHQMFLGDQQLEFEYIADPNVLIMGDPDLIKQATANLLSNAIKYTPEGGKVTIEVKKGTMMAQIHVEDTGVGMSKEDLKHCFSRFWRADAGRARGSGGLGIGLAIVKEIVERHNGWVNVESTEGVGSRFTIYIPLLEEEELSKADKRLAERLRRKNDSRIRQRFKPEEEAPAVEVAKPRRYIPRIGKSKVRKDSDESLIEAMEAMEDIIEGDVESDGTHGD